MCRCDGNEHCNEHDNTDITLMVEFCLLCFFFIFAFQLASRTDQQQGVTSPLTDELQVRRCVKWPQKADLTAVTSWETCGDNNRRAYSTRKMQIAYVRQHLEGWRVCAIYQHSDDLDRLRNTEQGSTGGCDAPGDRRWADVTAWWMDLERTLSSRTEEFWFILSICSTARTDMELSHADSWIISTVVRHVNSYSV